MSAKWMCNICKTDRIYDKRPQDGYCKIHPHELVVPVEMPEPPLGKALVPYPIPKEVTDPTQVEGLGVLVCDVSYSMDTAVFPDERKDLTRLQLVVGAVQSALMAMRTLSVNDKAYVAIIAFGKGAKVITDRHGRPFIRSVKSIINEFGLEPALQKASKQGWQWVYKGAKKEQLDQQDKWITEAFEFDHYIHDQFIKVREDFSANGTNITEALSLARKLTDNAIAGNLRDWGITEPVSLKRSIISGDKPQFTVPNVRVMIYSDGEHNQGLLENAFEKMQPQSVLLTSFIGDEEASDDTRKGADQMRSIANICPIHQQPGYYLINTLERRSLLREVFHMSTATSGFCRECALKSGVVAH